MRNLLTDALMWSCLIEILGIDTLHTMQLLLMKDQYVVQTLMIANEIFRRVSIRSGLPQLLCGPRVGRRARHTDMDHAGAISARVLKNAYERAEQEVSHLEAHRKPKFPLHDCGEKFSSSVPMIEAGAHVACTFGSCGRHTRRPSLSNSPRIRSAPQSRLFLAISLINAMV